MTKARKPQHRNPNPTKGNRYPRVEMDGQKMSQAFRVLADCLDSSEWKESQKPEVVQAIATLLVLTDVVSTQMTELFSKFEKFVDSVLSSPMLYTIQGTPEPTPEEPTLVKPEEGIEKPATPHE